MAPRASAVAVCGGIAGAVAAYVFEGGYTDYWAFPTEFTPPTDFSLAGTTALLCIGGFAAFLLSAWLVSAWLAQWRSEAERHLLRVATDPAELRSALCAETPLFLAPGICVLPLLYLLASDQGPGLAAVFALITAVVPPMALLLYRIISLLAPGSAEPPMSGENRASDRRPGWLDRAAPLIVAVLTAGFCAFFAVQTVRLYRALNLGYCDSGYVAEALSNTLRGRFMWCNSLPFGNYLGDHFSPILLLLLPFYALAPTHETLLAIHAIAIGSGAVPVYLLGRRLGGSRFIGLALSAAYLLHPAVQLQNFCFSYAFKAASLGVPLLLWAAYFGLCGGRRRAVLFAGFSLLALACEESLVPVVLSLAVFVAFRRGEGAGRRAGLLVAGLAIAWWVAATQVVMPHIRGGTPSKQLHTFYGWMHEPGEEASAGAMLLFMLRHPIVILKRFVYREVFVFLGQMLLPVGMLALLSPAVLAVGAITFVALVLSSENAFLSIAFQYKAGLIPVIFLATAFAMRKPIPAWLGGKLLPGRRRAMALGCLVVVSAALHSYAFGPAPLSYGYKDGPFRGDRHAAVCELQQLIPRDAALLATERAAAHFTHQRLLHRPGHGLEADYDFVLLDLESRWQDMDETFGMRNRYLADARYAPVFARDGFVLFQKGAQRPAELQRLGPAAQDVIKQVAQRGGWKVGEDAEIVHFELRPCEVCSNVDAVLVWRCLKTFPDDRGLLVTISRPTRGGTEAYGKVYRPCGGLFPTFMWKPGMVIYDRYHLRLPFNPLYPSSGEPRLDFDWAP